MYWLRHPLMISNSDTPRTPNPLLIRPLPTYATTVIDALVPPILRYFIGPLVHYSLAITPYFADRNDRVFDKWLPIVSLMEGSCAGRSHTTQCHFRWDNSLFLERLMIELWSRLCRWTVRGAILCVERFLASVCNFLRANRVARVHCSGRADRPWAVHTRGNGMECTVVLVSGGMWESLVVEELADERTLQFEAVVFNLVRKEAWLTGSSSEYASILSHLL